MREERGKWEKGGVNGGGEEKGEWEKGWEE